MRVTRPGVCIMPKMNTRVVVLVPTFVYSILKDLNLSSFVS